MLLLALSTIEAIYVVYMLRFYKTKINWNYFLINHQVPISQVQPPSISGGLFSLIRMTDPDLIISNWTHPETNSPVPISMVCPAGRSLSMPFGFFLIAREFFPNKKLEDVLLKKLINFVVLTMSASMSTMNLNVLLYLIPVFAIELVKLIVW